MRMRTMFVIAIFGLSGCGTSMMGDLDNMRNLVDEGRAENLAHLDASRTASTMPMMQSEMSRHTGAMSSMMRDYDGTMAGMESHCSGAGMADMRTMHDGVDGEMAQHSATMGSMTDLAAARAEVERHAKAMTSMMDGMDGAMSKMSCSM